MTKKKPCEEKIIFAPKMASENASKKRGYTYKSRILKFKIQQKVFNKKDANDTLNIPNFPYFYT